jgi:hypothetical protein
MTRFSDSGLVLNVGSLGEIRMRVNHKGWNSVFDKASLNDGIEVLTSRIVSTFSM